MVRKMIVRALVLVCGVLGFGASVAYANTNLISNSSFEVAAGGYPSGWTRVYWGTPAPNFSYPVPGRSGNGAAITYTQDSSGDARWQSAAISVEAGAQYTYSGWYASNAQTEINIEYQNSRGSKTYAWLTTLPSSGGAWKEVNVTFTIPAGAVKAAPYHLLDKKGVLTIDDVSVVKSSVTPPPPPSGSFNEGMVTLSFDDAWTTQYVEALPVLESAGMKGTFYILTQPVQNGWSSYMTPTQVKDIAQRGHSIEGHTVTHRDLTTLSQSSIDREIVNSRTYLQSLTGKTITSLAYPYGSNNAKVIDRTKVAGYLSARAADPTIPYGFNTKTTSRYVINSFSPNSAVSVSQIKAAIDKAKAEKLWFVLSIHEIKVNGDQYSMTPSAFREVVQHIQATGIKTVTMAEGAALLAQ